MVNGEEKWSIETIESLLEAINLSEKAAKVHKDQAELLKLELKKLIQPGTQAKFGQYKVSYNSTISKRLDQKWLKQEKPELYEEYCVETESTRLLITDTEDRKKPKLDFDVKLRRPEDW